MDAMRELSLDELDQVFGGRGHASAAITIAEHISKNDINYEYFAERKCPCYHNPFSFGTTCNTCNLKWIEG